MIQGDYVQFNIIQQFDGRTRAKNVCIIHKRPDDFNNIYNRSQHLYLLRKLRSKKRKNTKNNDKITKLIEEAKMIKQQIESQSNNIKKLQIKKSNLTKEIKKLQIMAKIQKQQNKYDQLQLQINEMKSIFDKEKNKIKSKYETKLIQYQNDKKISDDPESDKNSIGFDEEKKESLISSTPTKFFKYILYF